ncbi:hypothetical protein EDD17DRAFT_1506950 [Pisolithus thermaeus]|nr:hypothetical protein EDD17DRAFT_1506950 [Pisolithus thermaeus]
MGGGCESVSNVVGTVEEKGHIVPVNGNQCCFYTPSLSLAKDLEGLERCAEIGYISTLWTFRGRLLRNLLLSFSHRPRVESEGYSESACQQSDHASPSMWMKKEKRASSLRHPTGSLLSKSAIDLQCFLSTYRLRPFTRVLPALLSLFLFHFVTNPHSKNHLTDPVTGKIILSAVPEAYNRMLDTLGTVIQVAERALQS